MRLGATVSGVGKKTTGVQSTTKKGSRLASAPAKLIQSNPIRSPQGNAKCDVGESCSVCSFVSGSLVQGQAGKSTKIPPPLHRSFEK